MWLRPLGRERTPPLPPSGLGLGCGHSSPEGLRACSAGFQIGLGGLFTCLPSSVLACVHTHLCVCASCVVGMCGVGEHVCVCSEWVGVWLWSVCVCVCVCVCVVCLCLWRLCRATCLYWGTRGERVWWGAVWCGVCRGFVEEGAGECCV